MGRVSGKTVMITGAARGQGAAHAERLASEGATVILCDIKDAEGHALAGQIGASASYLTLDVGSEASWQAAADSIVTRHGRIDALVNNAGIAVMARLVDTDTALFERTVRINQFGTFLGLRFGAQLMDGGSGSIVNISSIAGVRADPHFFAYTGTKWAVRGMSRAAAIELAPRGIRVNTVIPGIIDTPMLTEAVPGLDVTGFASNATPLGRAGTPRDVAEAVLFLVSDDSSFISGAEIAVDGAITA